MAESDGLENRCGCMPTVGSNPTPSAQPDQLKQALVGLCGHILVTEILGAR